MTSRRPAAGSSGALARAIRLLQSHPGIRSLSQDGSDPYRLKLLVRVGLPFRWMAKGASPAGVRSAEPVTLVFREPVALCPPSILLRRDFDRSLAHVQPWLEEGRPVPCIYEGSLEELQQQLGLAGIVNQLIEWLENAALGTLIDPAQGWEPVRRDFIDDVVVADASAIEGIVDGRGGQATFSFEYAEDTRASLVRGVLGTEKLAINRKSISEHFRFRAVREWIGVGRSLGVVAWPGKLGSGELFVSGEYRPETVVDVGTLKERAEQYGCREYLESALYWLARCVKGWKYDSQFPLAVVLCARRPFHIVGRSSCNELCAYVLRVSAPELLASGDATPVRPAGHRDVLESQLLRRLSGHVDPPAEHWAQIGAGSLGSKIALHLAKAGDGPSAIVDRRNMSPHNFARHGLNPPRDVVLGLLGPKADELAEAISRLGQVAKSYALNIVDVIADSKATRKIFRDAPWAVVNSTASLVVREAFSRSGDAEVPRVIETSLFAGGRAGLLTVEGPERNPNTGDLIAEAYRVAGCTRKVRDALMGTRSGIERVETGQGCGSATMVMDDARLSEFAASMAGGILSLRRDGLPEAGRVSWGVVADDGLGLLWKTFHSPPSVVVAAENASAWRVRISDRVHRLIQREVQRWPEVETSGVLLGAHSEAAQAFYVVGLLPAPEDSTRSRFEFVLGTKGLRRQINEYMNRHGEMLYCLGTWHSHLRPSGSSETDRASAAAVGLARLAPSILLIHTPDGYRFVLAESA